jgi:threonyl-tRNA synthetase
MKILSLHCDYIKFKPLKVALKNPEQLSKEREKQLKVLEPLVILTAVEKVDEGNPLVVTELIKQITDIADQVKAKNIVLYPYAHLSNSLAKPDYAMLVLEAADKELTKKKYKVARAPFGYYKEFELKCKGHPLSELSREIKFEGNIEDLKIDHKQLLREVTKAKLDTSKLKDNDHRILGQQMDLFSFNDVAPGQPFWHNNGSLIFNKLIEFIRDLLNKYDYQEIRTPFVFDSKLYKVSGHWEHYKNNMFLSEYEKRDFGLKPMNCPGAMLVYKADKKSYKDLPIRLSEFGLVHRQELSGVLAGLFRVISITQDDAHIFCTDKQIGKEIENMLKMIKIIYKDTFNFEYSLELSTRPEKFMGDIKDWDFAEKELENALKKSKAEFKINKGDGAFYGPKIDLHIKDSLGRSWQCGTIQLDMQMPQRFQLSYTDKDNKDKTPIVLHRALLGSLERFIGILLEHTNGRLPLWLAPKQIRIINFTDKNNKAVEKLEKELKELGFRVDTDLKQEPIQGKIKEAELSKIHYIIVIGDKEEKSKSLAVRNKGKVKNIKTKDFIKQIQAEVGR